MIFLLLLLSLLAPICIGLLLSYFFRTGIPSFLFKFFLAPGFGLGISSCLFFIWLLIFGQAGRGFIIAEIGLLIILISLFLCRRRGDYIEHPFSPSDSAAESKGYRTLRIVFYILYALAVGLFIIASINRPHGDWDAWALWNMRARFIFRGGAQWRNVFSPLLNWSHPDYPLLLPGIISRCWGYIGQDAVIAPVLIAMLFTFVTAGLIVSSVSILRSKIQGILAGLVLLGSPYFIRHGASQYADVPLGLFFLLAIILLSFYDRLLPKNYRLLSLAGLAAGLSAWTKNEGLLFLISLALARLAAVVPRKGWRFYLREMLYFTLGFAPVLIIIIYFKTQLAPANDLLSSQGIHLTFERLRSLNRYAIVFKAFIREIIRFGKCVVNPLLILMVYRLLLGIKTEKKDKLNINTLLISLLLTLLGYFLIYLISPQALLWHLRTALSRLLLQLWPSFIFVYFLIVSTPEEALTHSATPKFRGRSQCQH